MNEDEYAFPQLLITTGDDLEELALNNRETTITELLQPCPTCGTDCHVVFVSTMQGREGGVEGTYTPL